MNLSKVKFGAVRRNPYSIGFYRIGIACSMQTVYQGCFVSSAEKSVNLHHNYLSMQASEVGR